VNPKSRALVRVIRKASYIVSYCLTYYNVEYNFEGFKEEWEDDDTLFLPKAEHLWKVCH
jgi:hypothetical protein